MSDVGRLRRRLVAALPTRVRTALRRSAPAPGGTRPSLAVVHDGERVVYSGAFAEPVRIRSLLVRSSSRSSKVTVQIDQAPAADFEFSVNLSELWVAGGRTPGRFDLFVAGTGLDGKPVEYRLGRFDHTDTSGALDPIVVAGAATAFGEPVRGWTHVTDQGNVSVRFAPDPARKYEVDGLRLDIGGRGISGGLLLRTFTRPARSIELRLVHRFSGRVEAVPVDVVPVDPARRHGLHEYRVALHAMPSPGDTAEAEGIVDPFLFVDLDGFDEPLRIPLFQKVSTSLRLRDLPVPTTDGEHVQLWVPYMTFRGRRLAFWTERFTVDELACLRRWSRWGWVLAPLRPFTGIWLVGEIKNKAQDNGFQLFRWIRQHHPKRRAYYVIDPDSPDRAKVEELGNVVLARSREHIRYTVLASRFVGSHHAEYLHASRSAALARHAGGLRIFLQHGVTGMKNVRLNYGRRHMQELPADRVVVNSEAERQIFVQDLDFFESQVEVAGFARFDSLFAGDPEVARRIVVMPTWRDWFTSRESALESDYLDHWQRFLTHPELLRLRDEYDVEVLLVLHQNLWALLDDLELEGVTIAPRSVDVQELLRTSAAVVTDYSSVAWDAAFLRRPVFFFRFDDDRLTGARVPFIDAVTELPGPVVHRAEDLVAEVVASWRQGFVMSDEYAQRAQRWLELPRDGYCERNYDMVRRADGIGTRLMRMRNRRGVREAFQRFRQGPQYFRVMRWLFLLGSILPRRDVAVFESDRGAAYGGSPRALFERLYERGTPLELHYVNNSTLRVPPGARKIVRLMPRYFWTMARARYWVFNQNVHEVCTRPRGTFYLQTWHGTPLKRMQNDVVEMFGRKDGYHEAAQELVDRWSALVSPSEFATGAFRSAFGFDGTVLETGYPGNDVFHTPRGEQRARDARARLGLAPDRRVVLYAPTFRDDARLRGAKGAWAHEMALDLVRFAERLGDDVTLLVRLHPLVRFPWPEGLSHDIVNVSAYPDPQDLLLVADALVTDYSSIMFDYAQTGRPIVLFVYDLEDYRDILRGFYLDLEEIAPGPLVRTSDEVIDAIARLDELSTAYADRLAAFRERFGSLEDGAASDRVIDAVFSASERGVPPT